MLRQPTAAWGIGTSCSCSSIPAAIAPIVTRTVCRRVGRPRVEAAAAVLERTERVEELQPAGYELYTDTDKDLSQEFAEYKRATQQMDELSLLQEELMNSVQTIDTLLTPQPQVIDTPEARRAKRQESRAARKVPMSAATMLEVQPAVRMPEVSLPSTTPSQQMSPAPSKAKRTANVPASTAPAMQLTGASPVSQPSLLPGSPSLSLARPSTQAWAATSLAVSAGPSLTVSSSSTARNRHQARASRNATKRNSMTPEVIAGLTSGTASSSSAADGTAQFMKSASATALLKPEQQKEVATVVKDFLRLKSIEKELKTILKRPPTIAEWARAAKAGDPWLFQARLRQGQDAKALMLKSNYRLVIKVVKAYQNRGLSLQDLIAEGMQGLLRGVEKFEVDKGFRFSTYAHWWIRQAVARALQDQGRAVRLPTHIHEQITRITMAKAQLQAKLGRMPSMTEISEVVGIAADKIPEILAAAHQASSLESPVAGDEDGGVEMKDVIACDRDQPDEVFADDMIRENINEVLTSLNPREAGVLRMHWGLDGHTEMTLEEIGAHFKITRERVRQLEARAMRLLKEHQNKLEGVMHELQHTSVYEVEAGGRASRGTRKT